VMIVVAVIDLLVVMNIVIEALIDVDLIMVVQDVMIIDVMIVMVVIEKNVVVMIFPREINNNLNSSKKRKPVIINFTFTYIHLFV
jgi:hypothetical protein